MQRQPPPNSASPRKTPPWRVAGFPLSVRLAQVAAVLLVGLLIGAFALTFSLRNQVRTGTGPNTPACATDTAASSRPVKSGVELTEGLRLHMVSERVGWAIGASAHNNNWASVLRTTDGGYHWKQVTPKQVASQGIDDLSILDETTAWLPTYGYRTTDGGATWQPLSGLKEQRQSFSLRQISMIPFSSIREFHAITEHTAWALIQESSAKDALYSKMTLYVTHDTGCTWKQRQLPPPAGVPKKVPSYAFGPTFFSEKDGALFAAFGQDATHDMYLYVTHDGGKSWQVQGNAIPGYVGVRSVVDDHHVIVDTGSVGGGIQMALLALSNGQWQQQATPPMKGGSAEVSFPSTSTGLALVRTLSNDFEVYRTTNGGKTWQHIATLPSAS